VGPRALVPTPPGPAPWSGAAPPPRPDHPAPDLGRPRSDTVRYWADWSTSMRGRPRPGTSTRGHAAGHESRRCRPAPAATPALRSSRRAAWCGVTPATGDVARPADRAMAGSWPSVIRPMGRFHDHRGRVSLLAGNHTGGRDGGLVPDSCQIGCPATAIDGGRYAGSNSHRPRSGAVRAGRRARQVPVEDRVPTSATSSTSPRASSRSSRNAGRRCPTPTPTSSGSSCAR
jgi:hypothetical protein